MFDEWGWFGERTPFVAVGVIRVALPGGPAGPTAECREVFRRIQEQFALLDQRARAKLAEFCGVGVAEAALTAIDLVGQPHERPRDFAFTYDLCHDWVVEFKDGEVLGYYPDG